jgi:HSP20 family molecular chaperone IbpA
VDDQPEGVGADQVSAKFEDGILRISMPIEKKLAKGRKVMIEGSEKEQKEKKVH